MPFKKQPFPIRPLPSFRMGLNDQQSPDEIQDFELADCENVSVEQDALFSAPGYSTWDDDIANHPGPYWGGFAFIKSDGTLVDVRQRLNKLEYSPDGGETWTECTLPTSGSPAATITLTQAQCCFASLNDVLLWTNGTDTVMSSTDGITWTLQASLPKCKAIFENAKNRVLFLNQTSSPFRLDWSNINDPLTIGASSYQLIDPNNHGKIIGAGLTPDGQTLIMKETGLYSISDYVDDGIIDVNFIGQMECVNHHTIATTNDSVIWAGFGAIWEYIGGTIRNIAGKISWIGRNQAESVAYLACGAFYYNIYYLSIPDADVSYDYNSQEYLIYKNLQRGDPLQPYVITRNRRYIGMYFKEAFEYDYGLDLTLFIGDSRSVDLLPTSGSPAVTENPIFAWVNPFRAVSSPNYPIETGLGGYAQDCYFTTKFFTEDAAFFTKRFKKAFLNFKVTQDLTITLSYRFQPYGTWTDIPQTMTANEINWIYDDLTEGGFSEGYGFSDDTLGQIFADIENSDKPRGIQFKVSWSQINDVQLYGMAFNYKLKTNFK